ncbi:hypothetical protein BDV37DRAFT_277308 [Aspergillus pseudonomiae]|uniref:S-adenosyl-L-methionine-dependent methyltransferase n=1 Tax=Aspergillus pseudonomiae TaxID=1506151 RepID=A0A5N7CS04_9EURO|nr:uncharacterized protein BDV37DRAFT_277308 [Aspergillus pseudonomiae]KAE8396914.1 hypothetical protein BDV37DRAFT_277308 [Aspergillus pseudonomiae]
MVMTESLSFFVPLESPDEKYYNHGRYYSASYRGLHPFPVDEREKDRQCRQIFLYFELFQGRLCPASISRPQTVLDVRTGIGSWAIQFADKYPSSILVYGIDAVHMQEEWVPINCEFVIDDLTQRDWHYGYPKPEFIHIGGLWGDRQILTCLLDGAYRCCLPNGMVEIWDWTVHFQDPNCEGALHRLYRDMEAAFRMGGLEHVYHLPLSLELPSLAKLVVENWAEGFEAYSMELLVEYLGKRDLEVLLSCAAARRALRQGVEGWLQV